ncbi:MAG TPA: RNA pseudouridine synthase, partial [Syntrophomonas sp.]|nr:RNA pseudouridine synthase [Syntrophomonas sp.]
MKKYQRQGHKGPNRQTHLDVAEPEELMKFLIDKLPNKSRNNIKSLLTHRQVLVDEQVVTQYNYPLQVGQKVIIDWVLVRDEKPGRGLRIIYEDKDIIIIDKPSGLLSIASDKEKQRTAYRQLTDYVRLNDVENRIFIVHRLDRETSGVMLFAKNEDIKRSLQDNWKETVVDRAYIAVVEGKIEKKEGKIKSWLQETKTRLVYSGSSPEDGQEAVTHYKVLEAGTRYSLLEIRLETGRKNQIRVHMKD